MKLPVEALATALMLSSTTACGIDLQFEYVEDPPPSHAQIEPEHIRIALGVAAGVRVTDGGDELDEDVAVDVQSNSRAVLAVDPTTERNVFVFYGVGEGRASVSVEIDGETFDDIPATVYRP